MKINLNSILIIVILILLGIGVFGYNYMNNKIEDSNEALRTEIIKKDSLRVENGIYKKLVGDTSTPKELRRLVDDLKLMIDDPIVVQEIILKPSDTVKETDTLIINEGRGYITDFYPNKDDYFIKYSNEFSIEDQQGISDWKFSDLEIDLAINQKDDGTFETNLKAPDFIKVGKLDVSALPLERQKNDFGILVGGGYGKDFFNGTEYLEVGGGIRYKKTYIFLEGNTNKQADIGVKFEL